MYNLPQLTTDAEALKSIIYGAITANKPHKYYDENVKNAQLYTSLVTGKGLDDLMHQFKPREDDEAFLQRKNITTHITQSVCKNIRDIEYKVPRSNSINRVYTAQPDQTENLEKLKKILAKFWGRYSFDDYMDLRWIELNDIDPNAFVVIEWKPFKKNEHAEPYPFEAMSENVFQYSYQNNILQYLIVRQGSEKVYVYTIYGPNGSVVMSRIADDSDMYKRLLAVMPEENIEYLIDSLVYIRIRKEIYWVSIIEPHNLGVVPALQVGYLRDPSTNGDTYLPPWWAAVPVLKKIVTANSELDLTQALHVFPQKIQYVRKCSKQGCLHGYMPDGIKCPVCHGVGYEVHRTAQDEILLPLPDVKEEMLDLTNLIYYVYPPIDLVKYMDEHLDKLSAKCMQLVYNSEIYSRKMIAETATGRNIDLQAVYDTLYPMIKEMSIDWEFIIAVIQKITDLDEDIQALFLFSKDFKLKSLDNYYEDLKMIHDSGASSFVKSSVEDDIARMIYADDDFSYNRYLTKKNFNPFLGDTDSMIMAKLRDPNVDSDYKVLFLNFEAIFDGLERTVEGFYTMINQKQWEEIQKQIALFKEKITAQGALSRAAQFGE